MKSKTLNFLLLMVLVIAGCGGGGGGGGGDGEEGSFETLSLSERIEARYEGNDQRIEITEENAFLAGYGVYTAVRMINHADVHIDRNSSIYHPDPNDPEDDELQYTVENLEPNEREGYDRGYVVTYSGHQTQGFTYSGKVIFRGTGRFETVAENTEAFVTYEKFELVDFSVVSDDQDYVLNGELVKVDSLTDSIDLSLVVNDKLQDKHFRLLNCRYEKDTDEFTQDSITSVSGEFSDSDIGTFTIDTDSPLVDLRYLRDADTWGAWAGQLSIQGENETGGLALMSGAFAAVLMDGDLDGELEKSLLVRMDSLSSGQPDTADDVGLGPVSNPGRELRAWVDFPVTLHGLFSHSSGQYLTHRWEVVTLPAGSLVEFDTLNVTTLNFTPDEVGDYVFKLVVDDGVSRSESHVKVRAEPDREFQSIARPVRTEVGALEINSPIELGQAIEIDGSSAMSWWGFGQESWYVNALHDSFDDNAELFDAGEQKRNLVINNPGIYEVVTQDSAGSYSTINVPFGTLFYDMKVTKGQLIDEYASSFVVEDYDGDGSDELIIMGKTTTVNSEFNIDVYDIDEFANFWLRERVPAVMPDGLSSGAGKLQSIDLNADGRLDVVITFSNGLLAFYQDGEGSLASGVHFDLSIDGCSSNSSIYGPIDMNGDGRVDLVARSFCENGSLVYWPQNENGEFNLGSYSVSSVVDGSIYSIELGDLNGDEYTDVIFGMVKDSNYSFNIAVNLGDNTFETRSTIPTQSNVAMRSGAIADINNDGINDVVRFDINRLYIYLQTSEGDFYESENLLFDRFVNEGKTFVRDFDQDGYVDILQGGSRLRLAVQQPDGSFDAALLAGGSHYGVSDLNDDGYDDIIVNSEFYSSIPEYRGFVDVYFSGLNEHSISVTN